MKPSKKQQQQPVQDQDFLIVSKQSMVQDKLTLLRNYAAKYQTVRKNIIETLDNMSLVQQVGMEMTPGTAEYTTNCRLLQRLEDRQCKLIGYVQEIVKDASRCMLDVEKAEEECALYVGSKACKDYNEEIFKLDSMLKQCHEIQDQLNRWHQSRN